MRVLDTCDRNVPKRLRMRRQPMDRAPSQLKRSHVGGPFPHLPLYARVLTGVALGLAFGIIFKTAPVGV